MVQPANLEVLDGVKKLFAAKFPSVQNVKKAEIVWICNTMKGMGVTPTPDKIIYVRGYKGTPHVVKKHIEAWQGAGADANSSFSHTLIETEEGKPGVTLTESKPIDTTSQIKNGFHAPTGSATPESEEDVRERIRRETGESRPIIGLGILLDRMKRLEERVLFLERRNGIGSIMPPAPTPRDLKLKDPIPCLPASLGENLKVGTVLENGYLSTDVAPSRKTISLQKPSLGTTLHHNGATPPMGTLSDLTTMWIEIHERIKALDLKPFEIKVKGDGLGLAQMRWMLGIADDGRDFGYYIYSRDAFSPYLFVKYSSFAMGSPRKGNLVLHRVGHNFIQGLDQGSPTTASPRDIRNALKYVHDKLHPIKG